MVCGDAAFLGGWQPEKALPLYTTPGDYPAWSAKVSRLSGLIASIPPFHVQPALRPSVLRKVRV